jgi:hypothetical protein
MAGPSAGADNLRLTRYAQGPPPQWGHEWLNSDLLAGRALGSALDSLIEIGASAVVIWELSGTGEARQRRALHVITYAFAALTVYLVIQSTRVLISDHHAASSPCGIAWTAIAMFGLAAGKNRVGRVLDNPGRVTLIDGILASAVLTGLAMSAAAGW